MTVYIVIPVHNRRNMTRDCLSSLECQAEQEFAVIVVDDGSTDGTSEMIRQEFPDVVLLSGNGDLWWVGAINLGIRYVMQMCGPEDLVLTLNNDLVVSPNYIGSLLHAAQSRPDAIIGSVETTEESPRTIKNGGYHVNWVTAKNTIMNKGRKLDDFPPNYLLAVPKLTGRGTLFPTKVFRKVGLYDDVHFKQCGDMELPSRAHLKHGYQLFVCYDSVVISRAQTNDSVNSCSHYTVAQVKEYFFGIRSHYNIKDHYWFAHNIAPNRLWFLRFVTLELLRNVYHFVSRLRLF